MEEIATSADTAAPMLNPPTDKAVAALLVVVLEELLAVSLMLDGIPPLVKLAPHCCWTALEMSLVIKAGSAC